jgi:hypothetical protein
VQTEHQQYFDALNRHPRTLVGTSVPSRVRGGGGKRRARDDAREWQEAVKSLLVDEVKDRAGRAMEENAGFLDTIHASIDLFTTNADLIPGSREFDVDLANRFTDLAAPYELRVDGKLQGYSIPVQPIIDQLRTKLTEERSRPSGTPASETAASSVPAAGTGTPPPAPVATSSPPQAGIVSKAGNGSQEEDFSVLFGTIGLPNLRI